ncbi:MAG: helix-turn-helix transcriptional regulator [Marinomonas sp.]
MKQNLSINLRLLCSYYKSVAQVCRRLSINRAQFNRYLNGTTVPSSNTLRRVCDFFGVEVAEIFLPAEQFEKLVQTRPVIVNKEAEADIEQSHWTLLNQSGQQGVEKYCGYYFEYYLSMGYPGKILRSLVMIESHHGKTYYQRIERLKPIGMNKAFHGVYKGMVLLLSDRLFLVDYEAQTRVEMTQTILYPSFRNRVVQLSGLRLGVSATSERAPSCVRVIYQAIGNKLTKRKMLSLCGLYDLDSEQIDQGIRQSIINKIEEGEWHFKALL